jgi:hypothetical protein
MSGVEDADHPRSAPKGTSMTAATFSLDVAQLRALLSRLDPDPPEDGACRVPGCLHASDHVHPAPEGVPIAA